MPNAPLDVLDRIAGVALVPGPVQVLGDGAKLDDEVLAEVFWFGLTPLLTPEPDEPASSLPMTIRASEPPMKERRSVIMILSPS